MQIAQPGHSYSSFLDLTEASSQLARVDSMGLGLNLIIRCHAGFHSDWQRGFIQMLDNPSAAGGDKEWSALKAHDSESLTRRNINATAAAIATNIMNSNTSATSVSTLS